MARAFDPRLTRYASATRWYIAAVTGLGLVRTSTTIGFAWLVANTIGGAIAGRPMPDLVTSMGLAAAVVGLRAGVLWSMDAVALRGAAVVKKQLRVNSLRAIGTLGPGWLAGRNSAAVNTVIGRGLESLDAYFALYLPQVMLAVVTVPVLLVVLFAVDPFTGITVLVTLPLIPVFMALIGLATRSVQAKAWQQLARLSTAFLDVAQGMSTLMLFGRQHRQAERIAQVTDEYRARTLQVLRVSFLSGFVLELAASLSVALVAVSIGIRLIDGTIGLSLGLFLLLLTPEAYLPLRQIGANYHAAAEGIAASDEVFEILDAAAALLTVPLGGRAAQSSSARAETSALTAHDLTATGLRVAYGDHVVLEGVDARFQAGRISVVSGPSGVGKSTLVGTMLGFVAFEGDWALGGERFGAGQPLRDRVAWTGAQPDLVLGTIQGNVVVGDTAPDAGTLERALRLAAVSDLDPGTRLGVGGRGLSGGQAQRVAIARAFYRALRRDCPVIVLDEPSSALDERTEHAVLQSLRHFADEGHVVILISHRQALIRSADDEFALVDGTLV
ncbi:MAG: thiol reductant ABC exporter subunit CydD [Microbacteriaceae bacterium]